MPVSAHRPTTPTDYLLKLDLADIGPLHHNAFRVQAPKLVTNVFAICLWLSPGSTSDTKVIANCGNMELTQPGWTIYVSNAELTFRVNLTGSYSLAFSIPLPNDGQWHHFTVNVFAALEGVDVFLDGQQCRANRGNAQALGETGAVRITDDLSVGGYTDAAGGHFDFRFGRTENEWVDDLRIYARALTAEEVNGFFRDSSTRLNACVHVTPRRNTAPATLTFDASASTESANLIAYLWEFSDGSRAVGATTCKQFAVAGRYVARLTVIDHAHASASKEQIVTLDGDSLPEQTPVFRNGNEGYACFRIPAVVQARNGDLLAFAEGRLLDCSDATQTIHIVSKRSTDGGKTWQPLVVVAQNVAGDADFACMNPAPVVDTRRGTGRIVVVFNKTEHSEWAVIKGQGVIRVACIHSDDDGHSWSRDRDITPHVHRPFNPDYTDVYPHAALPEHAKYDWRKHAPTLGHAIQLSNASGNDVVDGRLFFVGSRSEGDESVFETQNYAFWSDDLGASWVCGTTIDTRVDGTSAKGLGEATAAELEDGRILINSRNYQRGTVVGHRALTVARFTTDGDIQYDPTAHAPELTDSGVQAGLLYCASGSVLPSQSVLLFSNPAHPSVRKEMTIRVSLDNGATWPLAILIEPGPSSYSDMVAQPNGRVGLLFERGNQGGITFVVVNVRALIDANT